MKTNFLLSCLAALILFLTYSERHGRSPSTSVPVEETTSAPLFPLAPEAVSTIILHDTDQCVVAHQNGESSDLLYEMSEMLLRGRVVRRFPPSVTDLSVYGLALASWRITITTKDATTRQPVLLLGRLNPVGNAVYARWDDDEEVLLVGSYLLTALDVVFERLRSSAHAGITVDTSCEEEGRVTQQGGEP